MRRSLLVIAALAATGILSAAACSDTAVENPPVDPPDQTGIVPPKPGADKPPPEGAVAMTFAVNKLFLGSTDRDGKPNTASGWKKYGFNLDGKVSTEKSEDLCKPREGANPANIYQDGEGGIDNSFGRNILPVVRAAAPDAESSVNQSILDGSFTLLLNIDQLGPDAEVLGHRVLKRLERPFLIHGMSVHVAASIGLTCSSSGNRTELLRQADTAMYAAKRSGTGLAVYDPSRHADSSGHLALVEELRTALSTGQLVLHHQPQVDVSTGCTVGVEALVRWAHPVRGLLAPAQFLPLAEVHGLMGAVTEEVLRQAVAQAADWRRRGLELRISVNLSASNLLDTDLPRRVAALLADAGLPAGCLVLEVTETVLMGDAERSLAVVTALTALGLTVSIDDFGTGYSSLSYLRDLPVAELKLDRSFTADLLVEARTEAIVASTIDLAHRLGLRVVAEGVEHEATLARLAHLGCDESQGYLHSPPLPADLLEQWLDQAGTAQQLLQV